MRGVLFMPIVVRTLAAVLSSSSAGTGMLAASSVSGAGAASVYLAASTEGPIFTHVFNVYDPGKPLPRLEVQLVSRSWANAFVTAKELGVSVEYIVCVLERDEAAVRTLPSRLNVTVAKLSRWAEGPGGHFLPSMAEIFSLGVSRGQGRFLIYTNQDIGLYPSFYVRVALMLGVDVHVATRTSDLPPPSDPPKLALDITKLVLRPLEESDVANPPELSSRIWETEGLSMKVGHDCFVLPRLDMPNLLVDNNLVIGSPPWGKAYAYKLAVYFGKSFDYVRSQASNRLTFDLGGPSGWTREDDETLHFQLQQCADAFRLLGPAAVAMAQHDAAGRGKKELVGLPCTCMQALDSCKSLGARRQLPSPICAYCAVNHQADLAGWPAHHPCNNTVTIEQTSQFKSLYLCAPTVTEEWVAHVDAWVRAGRPPILEDKTVLWSASRANEEGDDLKFCPVPWQSSSEHQN